MGVQDYDDLGFKAPDYYDPDEPFGDQYGSFPNWPGLMDRAQSLTFTPVGLRRDGVPVPTYLSNGNHDGLVQGNEDAIKTFEDIATGCFKVAQSTSTLPIRPEPDPNQLFSPALGFAVRPDEPGRRFVDRVELKNIYFRGHPGRRPRIRVHRPGGADRRRASRPPTGRATSSPASASSRSTRSPTAASSRSPPRATSTIPQCRWLEPELDRAEEDGKLVVAFGHHPIRSLVSDVPDEAAQRCSGSYDANGSYSSPDEHGHDANPGCDLDPRPLTPLHLGDDLSGLLSSHPNVIAYVAGHTHEHKVLACGSDGGCPAGGNWWEINTSAAPADWPQQSRLIELMDNRDGTLSIFGTLTDPAARLALPGNGTSASGFGNDELASISHAIGFNDPQVGDGKGEGAAQDQNVELLVDDPRTATLRGTPGDDVIRGTPGRDVILCGAGDDIVVTGAGNDVIRCGPGNDLVKSGRGNDRVSGGSGRDRLYGGPGRDRLFGRSGADRIFGQGGNDLLAGGGGSDRMFGGAGRDRMSGGPARDRLVGGSGRDRIRGGGGADRLSGRRGNDHLFGGRGRDRLFGGPGRDVRRQ